MKRQVSASTKCPYYKCEERHEVFCAGPQERTSIHVAFAIPTEKKEYMKSFCKSIAGCSRCAVARALAIAETEN